MRMLASSGPPVRLRRTIINVTPSSAADVRRRFHPRLEALGINPDTIFAVELALSELVTNAFRYATGGARVAVTVQPKTIRVSCTDDHADTAAEVRPAENMLGDDDCESKRGLLLLEELSTSGIHVRVHPRAASKSVAVRVPIGENDA